MKGKSRHAIAPLRSRPDAARRQVNVGLRRPALDSASGGEAARQVAAARFQAVPKRAAYARRACRRDAALPSDAAGSSDAAMP